MGVFLQSAIGERSGTVITFAVHSSGPPAGTFSAVATTDAIVQIHGIVKTTGAGNLTAQINEGDQPGRPPSQGGIAAPGQATRVES